MSTRPYVAHGLSMVAWLMEYESDVPPSDHLAVWNAAMDQSRETDSRVVEQSNRIQMVHPADVRCQFCPPKLEEQKPLANTRPKTEPPQPK